MGIGASVLLLALGAILVWAVTGEVQGLDLDVVGVILMVAGAIGLLWSMLATSGMPWRRRTVVEDDAVVRERAMPRV